MSDLKTALLDAKYIDMISLGDFVVRDCGLPDVDADGNLMPQANEIAAALFRWAANMEAEGPAEAPKAVPLTHAPEVDDANDNDDEYDEFGDPIVEATDVVNGSDAASDAPSADPTGDTTASQDHSPMTQREDHAS